MTVKDIIGGLCIAIALIALLFIAHGVTVHPLM